jgi:hypothetical protein
MSLAKGMHLLRHVHVRDGRMLVVIEASMDGVHVAVDIPTGWASMHANPTNMHEALPIESSVSVHES